jgi:hypothetical protein
MDKESKKEEPGQRKIIHQAKANPSRLFFQAHILGVQLMLSESLSKKAWSLVDFTERITNTLQHVCNGRG